MCTSRADWQVNVANVTYQVRYSEVQILPAGGTIRVLQSRERFLEHHPANSQAVLLSYVPGMVFTAVALELK